MDVGVILAIVSALSSLLTLLCVQLRKSKIKEIAVCDGHCLKIRNAPSTRKSSEDVSPVDSVV